MAKVELRACFKNPRSALIAYRDELPTLPERPDRPRMGVYQTFDSRREIWRPERSNRYAPDHQCDLLHQPYGQPTALPAPRVSALADCLWLLSRLADLGHL